MLSYAQVYEDVYLERCFKDKESGFYIDIGASHPVLSNSSYHFYQRGWNGVSVEPTPFRLKELVLARPRDINLGSAVSAKIGRATFNVSTNADHLSSLIPQDQHLIDTHSASISAISVEVITLDELCKRHVRGAIDFLKIDVEGSEADVISGGDWGRWRPSVVVVEATLPGSPTAAWDGWEPMLLSQKYQFVFFDGVNRYYVADEAMHLAEHFKVPVNPFDGAVALYNFGFVLDDVRHPDHAWAKSFAKRIFAAAAADTPDHLQSIMTCDLMDTELNSPASPAGVTMAFQRVLGRSPAEADVAHWANQQHLPLARLFKELLAGEEFRTRRSRTSIYSMWR